MIRKHRSTWLLAPVAALAALAILAAACGSTGTSGGTTNKGTLTIAGFDFAESSILGQLYGQELAHNGYTVNYKARLGKREVVAPAIKAGQIDMYPGYAATDLEYYNSAAGEATGDVTATVQKLNARLQPLGLEALTPSPAVDQNAFAVTKATATQYKLSKLSDLAAVGSQLVLGAGPECPTRPFCQPGLEKTYGIHFKSFKALDTDGPLTRAALANNTIQVGLVFSSDSDLNKLGLVVLQDDKHLENADNVVPIIRTNKLNNEIRDLWNSVSAKLTTSELVGMNKKLDIDRQDPDAIATDWLRKQGFKT